MERHNSPHLMRCFLLYSGEVAYFDKQMVPPVGIEPTLLAEPDFESGVSTNFTTEAWARIVTKLWAFGHLFLGVNKIFSKNMPYRSKNQTAPRSEMDKNHSTTEI